MKISKLYIGALETVRKANLWRVGKQAFLDCFTASGSKFYFLFYFMFILQCHVPNCLQRADTCVVIIASWVSCYMYHVVIIASWVSCYMYHVVIIASWVSLLHVSRRHNRFMGVMLHVSRRHNRFMGVMWHVLRRHNRFMGVMWHVSRRHNRFMVVMWHVSRPRLFWYRFLLFALHESDTRNAVFNHGFSKGLH
jgi:hypothetical protein